MHSRNTVAAVPDRAWRRSWSVLTAAVVGLGLALLAVVLEVREHRSAVHAVPVARPDVDRTWSQLSLAIALLLVMAVLVVSIAVRMLLARREQSVRGQWDRFYRDMFDELVERVCRYRIDDLEIVAANRAWSEAYGLLPADVVGRRLSDVLPAEDFDALHDEFCQLTLVDPVRVHLSPRATPDGVRWERWTNRLISRDAFEVISVGHDVTEEHEAHQALQHDATHDPLTGLANRTLLRERITSALTDVPPRRPTLLFIDLDRFKQVNDTCGHSAGDELLCQVATRLLRSTRGRDTVARVGGDEFIVLCDDADDDEVRTIAERLRGNLRRPFRLGDGTTVSIAASIGVAAPDETGVELEASVLVDIADAAAYVAKRSGGDVVVVGPGH